MVECRTCHAQVQEYAHGGGRGRVCIDCYRAKNRAYNRKSFYERKVPCPNCGRHKIDPLRSKVCQHCHGSVNIRAKVRGNPSLHKASGYWIVKLPPDDPMISMANGQHHVRQHRLVMADYIGRPLTPDEVVHHVNHDRGDNRIENLRLMSNVDHNRLHAELRAREGDD